MPILLFRLPDSFWWLCWWLSPWISKVKYFICYIWGIKWSKHNQNTSTNAMPQMWSSTLNLVMIWTIKFQGQIFNLLYLRKSYPIATKRRTNISMARYASNVVIRLDLNHDFDCEISSSNMSDCVRFYQIVNNVSWVAADSYRGVSRCWRVIDSSSRDTIMRGPLARYAKLRIAHALGMPATFSPPQISNGTASKRSRHALRHVRHARAVMHVGIAKPWRRGKRSRHSRRM